MSNFRRGLAANSIKKIPIIFEDPEVKRLCVENWGGHYIEGEITEYEASKVTSLNGVFYNNTTITKFNEFRYFTGVTSLYKSGSGDTVFGQFANCSNLVEITIPSSVSDFRGAFRYSGIVNLDISPTTATTFRIESMVQGASSGTTALRTVKLPGASCTGIIRGFRRARGLTTIEIDGTLDVSRISAFTSVFGDCVALANITGTIIGIKHSIIFTDSPLTRDSALVILNGLDSSSPNNKIKFKASTYNLLTEDDIAIATDKGWSVASA